MAIARRTPVLRFGVVVVMLAGTAVAQTTLHTQSTLVVVPTLVQTPGRAVVYSLTAKDFVLTDNGVAQRVTLEEESKRPLSLVVVMQTGGAGRAQFASYAGLESMLENLVGGAPNQAAIVNFDSRPERASPFTSDVAEWKDAIDHPDAGNSGAAIYDGVAYALDMLRTQPQSNRRAILLISQGHDEGSTTAAKEIVRRLSETNTAIYSVTFSAEKTAFKEALKAPGTENPPWRVGDQDYVAYFNFGLALNLAIDAMKKDMAGEMAALSGGAAEGFDGKARLDAAMEALTNRIKNTYILSFAPTSAKVGLHTIHVGLVGHPELMVSARSGYWAESADAGEDAR
jgi:VWFA-related protein